MKTILTIFIFFLIILLYFSVILKKQTFFNKKNIINKDDIILVHIGKTGGTLIKYFFKLKQIHHSKMKFRENKKYIISIRNPLNRFISAFNMWSTFAFEKDLDYMKTIDTAYKIYKKKGVVKKNYIELIKYFETPNNLAESITSNNITRKQKALELMNSKTEHIFKGIGYYLDNGNFVEKYHKNIIYVTKQETLKEDIKNISKMLNIYKKFSDYNGKTMVNKNKDKYLSPLAIKNLKDFYKETDYKALHALHKYNFISKEYLDYCYTYKF